MGKSKDKKVENALDAWMTNAQPEIIAVAEGFRRDTSRNQAKQHIINNRDYRCTGRLPFSQGLRDEFPGVEIR